MFFFYKNRPKITGYIYEKLTAEIWLNQVMYSNVFGIYPHSCKSDVFNKLYTTQSKSSLSI